MAAGKGPGGALLKTLSTCSGVRGQTPGVEQSGKRAGIYGCNSDTRPAGVQWRETCSWKGLRPGLYPSLISHHRPPLAALQEI